VTVIRRNGYARPYPEGIPTRPGARCPMSDLLESECACPKHRGKKEETDDRAEPLDLDFG
jgi:hypothetical protein